MSNCLLLAQGFSAQVYSSNQPFSCKAVSPSEPLDSTPPPTSLLSGSRLQPRSLFHAPRPSFKFSCQNGSVRSRGRAVMETPQAAMRRCPILMMRNFLSLNRPHVRCVQHVEQHNRCYLLCTTSSKTRSLSPFLRHRGKNRGAAEAPHCDTDEIL